MFTDPTGHSPVDAMYKMITDCYFSFECGFEADSYPEPPFESNLIDFEGDWTEEEMRAAHQAALDTGAAFARMNRRQGLTAEQAFLMAYGGKVTFEMVATGACDISADCVAGVREADPRRVEFFRESMGRSLEGNGTLIVHELGHVYDELHNNAPSAALGRATTHQGQSLGQRNIRVGTEMIHGFAFDARPNLTWQKSNANTNEEVFADMFIGWVYNTWGQNDVGQARGNWMNNHMGNWRALDIDQGGQ